MPPNAGEKQERLLYDYLRTNRFCWQVIEGDRHVRNFLNIKGMPKCADAIGLHQPMNFAGPKRVTVAESKGTDMNSAVQQLGNAAAGIFEKFGRETKIELVVMVPALQERPSGALSPGHGYRVTPLKTGLNKFTLHESMGGPPVLAQPRVTYPEWFKWSLQVSLLRIVVLVLSETTH